MQEDIAPYKEYTKKKIINAFLQKPIGIHDLIKEAETSYNLMKRKKGFPPSDWMQLTTYETIFQICY